ncbi:MAG: hypothetical protein NTZ33_00930 [Bacteroidetes bacterium]|nr:hypothetical protein [Bacteroidota bacterium]
MKTKLFLLLLIISSFIFKSCAPVFSELQGARTVGKNRIELTPSYSSVSISSETNSYEVQKDFGLQAAYGLTSNFDFRFRYEYIWISENSLFNNSSNLLGIEPLKSVNVLGMGPKYCFVKDIFSFYLPIGLAFGGGINADKTWELHPTLLFSIPLSKNKVELNISPKYLVSLANDNDDLIAFNFGVSFSDDLTKWAVRPEYGLLYDPKDSGHYSHFSIGFSICFGK